MVERSLLKRSIDEWMDWFVRTSSSQKAREQKLILPGKQALALIGVRRCGKSHSAVHLAELIKNRTFYFNFEDPIFLVDNGVENLDELLSVFIEYYKFSPQLLIFDEIQNIYGWEKWIRKSVDLGKYQIVLTGSSAKLLSSEIATSISGRCIEEKVWPLSFSEYLDFTGSRPKTNDEFLAELSSYLQWGGFPEVVLLGSQIEKRILLKQYLNDIVLKDVVNRHQIRLKKSLDQIVVHFFTNVSSLFSYSRIKNSYQINVETVQEYTRYLNDAFLFFEVSRYHPNLKVQARDPKKIYSIDTGLRNIHSQSIQDDLGKLAENAVFIHLKRFNCELTYFKEQGEVDFLVMHFGKPISAIQVCYSNMNDQLTRKREVGSLIECLKHTGLKEGIILTLSREETLEIENYRIRFIPLFRWLSTSLEFSSLSS